MVQGELLVEGDLAEEVRQGLAVDLGVQLRGGPERRMRILDSVSARRLAGSSVWKRAWRDVAIFLCRSLSTIREKMLKLRESNFSLPMISSQSVEARSASLRSEMRSLRFSNFDSVGVLRAEAMVFRSCLAATRCFSSEVSLR